MPATDPQRRTLIILLLSAAFVFSAGLHTISLQSLDDAFYARKGVEMHRSGHIFTVTMGGEPTFQNPPLQFWIIGQSYALFGESDAAARLPIVLMALGMLLATWRLGTSLLDRSAGIVAIALLLITPLFVSTARGTMMEIPFGFWVTMVFLCFVEGCVVEGTSRRAWHLAIAVPIGAAMLTKSVLALVPLTVIPMAIALSPELRRRCGFTIWMGLALGVALGLSWPLHQWMLYGPEALRQHYLGQVLEPSTQQIGVSGRLFGYPLILLRSFEPILLPGLAGAVMLARRWWRERDWRALVIVLWMTVPVLIASLSSAQSSRYIFPILPPLALAAARWSIDVLPAVASIIARWVAPAIACVAAALLWINPLLLTRDANRIVKMEGARLQREIPASARIGYVGSRYWRVANPVTFYADRSVAPLNSAADLCQLQDIRFVVADTEQISSLQEQCGLSYASILSTPEWVLFRINR
jgi:4-amino-4-deoxy-L-arabinose transferase-like glycosyltransferase